MPKPRVDTDLPRLASPRPSSRLGLSFPFPPRMDLLHLAPCACYPQKANVSCHASRVNIRMVMKKTRAGETEKTATSVLLSGREARAFVSCVTKQNGSKFLTKEMRSQQERSYDKQFPRFDTS